jgi:hypothetical protein
MEEEEEGKEGLEEEEEELAPPWPNPGFVAACFHASFFSLVSSNPEHHARTCVVLVCLTMCTRCHLGLLYFQSFFKKKNGHDNTFICIR